MVKRIGLLDVMAAVAQWGLLLAIRAPLILVGLFVVAAAIPFRRGEWSVKHAGRRIVNLPRWAWLWGNDYDGLMGDKRCWWHENADSQVLFGLLPLLRRLGLKLPRIDSTHPLAMWWWAAVRNPVNNFRLVPGLYCPVSECAIDHAGDAFVADKPGQGGWQFVRASRSGGRSRWYGFYLVYCWSEARAFVIRLGYKVEPRHQGTMEDKGMTFKVIPFKNIA